MQILIVDDDLSTVECICSSIDWQEIGIEKVHTAHSKSGALAVLECNDIDIVLSDIEMPMGSGLELLQEVRSIGYYCDFIFLTCHDSFSFASAALEYRAASYVLKPFDPERVRAEIVKAVDNQKYIRQVRESSRYGELWLKNRAGIEKYFWRDLLTNKLPQNREEIMAEALSRGLEPDGDASYMLCLFSFQYDTLPNRSGISKEKFAVDAITAPEGLSSASSQEGGTVSWWRGERLHVFHVHAMADSAYMAATREMLKKCRERTGAVVNGYAAKAVSIEQLPQTCQALEKMDRNNVGDQRNLQFYDEQSPGEARKMSIDLTRFRSVIAGGNKVRILTYLRAQLEAIAPERALTPAMLYAAQQEIIQEVYLYLLVKGIKLELPTADDDAYTVMVNASTSMYNMLKWLSFFINYAVDADSPGGEKKTAVEQAKTFIDAHYSEKITQNEISKAVFLTPGHLSRVFKKETGISINQYINDKRISQAKELLINSDVDINEVALRSGFSSSSYFITSFRKVTGETPKEFRDRHLNKE